jgi:alpha-glucosidase
MPWSVNRKNSGFSKGAATWLPIPGEHRKRAVDLAEGDSDSPLHAFRRLLKWRKGVEALRSGEIKFIVTPEPVLAFVRSDKALKDGLLCVFNLAAKQVMIELKGEYRSCLEECGLPKKQLGVAFKNGVRRSIKLPPFGVFFAEIV